jgi:CheY-like chemotaxis protein
MNNETTGISEFDLRAENRGSRPGKVTNELDERIQQSTANLSPDSATQTDNTKLINSRIMIVDDEKEISDLFSMILTKAGFYVGPFAYDGEEAVQEFKKHSEEISVILIDMRLPKKDGIETSMQIKKLNPSTKILMVSAYEVPKEKKDLFDSILEKPVKRKALLDAVSKAFDRGTNNWPTALPSGQTL